MFYAHDMERRASKMIGYEEYGLKFMSVDEYSVFSSNEERKKYVDDRIQHLKTTALNKSLLHKNKMYATIDFVIQKASLIVAHSDSRIEGLKFSENPFLEMEKEVADYNRCMDKYILWFKGC